MEQRSKRPDSPATAHATVRAAVAAAAELCPRTPLFAGGKSFGGRMTSQALAETRAAESPHSSALSSVRGVAFLGFPLHPAKTPGAKRADHLADVTVPMLFLQGTRDELADLTLLTPIVERLGKRATLHIVEHADHSFHVLKRSGRTDEEVMEELLDTLAAWIRTHATGVTGRPGP
jgi:predicted alpha/beta-hydrolase family hydrolase